MQNKKLNPSSDLVFMLLFVSGVAAALFLCEIRLQISFLGCCLRLCVAATLFLCEIHVGIATVPLVTPVTNPAHPDTPLCGLVSSTR